MTTLSHKDRLQRHLAGQEVDRIPALGGWMLGVENLATLAGITVADYLRDPLRGVVRANQALGVDALVSPVVPTDIHSIRGGALEEQNFAGREPEELQQRADQIPDTEAGVLAAFDPAATRQHYLKWFTDLRGQLDGLEFFPNDWGAPANFSLYFQYGYEAFLAAVALYPVAVGKIYWQDGLLARERNKIVVQLMRELDVLPVMFTGHDICINDGPMCSPEFLRQYYWPHAKTSLTPFVEAGIRVICHCDGNVMPLIDDMLGAGFSGFQGFQYECGVDPRAIRQRRSAQGEELLLMAGLSVTRTLPFGTIAELETEVDYLLDVTAGGRGMFLISSNVIGVEVPPAKVRAAYDYLARFDPRRPYRPNPALQRWPWIVAHPQ